METIVYAVIHVYSDLEHHYDLHYIYDSKEKALEKALELSNNSYLGHYEVVKWNVTKGEQSK